MTTPPPDSHAIPLEASSTALPGRVAAHALSAPTAEARASVCDCVRTNHQHGNYITYSYHRCRCPQCTAANAEYCRQSRVHRKRLRPMVAAGPARVRVMELLSAGLILDDIATLCGLKPGGLDNLMYGHKGRGATQIQATTMTALAAISYRDVLSFEVPGARAVDGGTARLQIQALHAHGWTASVLAARIGASRTSMSMLLSGHGIREDLRVRIDAIYRELHGTEAPADTMADRKRRTVAKAKAAANGWTTDMVHDPEYAGLLLAS